jgi:integrase
MHRRLKRTLKRAGIREELSLHGLRHTFGTRLAAAGVPLVKIQEWMGHEASGPFGGRISAGR